MNRAHLFALAAVAAISLAVPVTAEDGLRASVQQCSRMEEGPKRLACFDALLSPPVTPTEHADPENTWTIRTQRSPIDDTRGVVLTVKIGPSP